MNDFIINVGQTSDNLQPAESARTEQEANKRAEELTQDYKYVEVVYMPVDDIDTNEIVWSNHKK